MKQTELQGKRLQLIASHEGFRLTEPKFGVVLGHYPNGDLLVKWDGSQTVSFLHQKSKIKTHDEI